MSENALVNVARFLPEQARLNPRLPAVRVPVGRRRGAVLYEERSFAELDRESDACARLLRERGISRGTRTLLMVRPGLELILCTFALFKVGAVPVVIDPGMGLQGFLACVRRTEPEALLGIPLAQRLAALFRGTFRSVGTRVAVGDRSFRESLAHQMLAGGGPEMARTQADDLAAILFTSGSTGAPKGVCYEHGMFEAQVRLLRQLYGIRPGEVDLPMLPVFALFNPALGMLTVVPKMNPSRPAKADPWEIVQAIRQNGVTNSFGSPVLWRKIADYCERRRITLPTLRRILMAGASVPPSLVRRFRSIAPGAEVHTPYGATECLPLTSIPGSSLLGEVEALSRAGKGSCVGRPAEGIELRVVQVVDGPLPQYDPLLDVPQGEIGEIAACGPVVTREYDRLPEATAAAKMLDAQGRTWHRMGDLGYLDESGRLWFCGRKVGRVVLPAGDGHPEQVFYTDCCEAIFNAHPDVARSALIAIRKNGVRAPAIAIEPLPGKFPRGVRARADFIEELSVLGQQHPHTQGIHTFVFEKAFPVDVRHNAKIHRLALGRKHSGKG